MFLSLNMYKLEQVIPNATLTNQFFELTAIWFTGSEQKNYVTEIQYIISCRKMQSYCTNAHGLTYFPSAIGDLLKKKHNHSYFITAYCNEDDGTLSRWTGFTFP